MCTEFVIQVVKQNNAHVSFPVRMVVSDPDASANVSLMLNQLVVYMLLPTSESSERA